MNRITHSLGFHLIYAIFLHNIKITNKNDRMSHYSNNNCFKNNFFYILTLWTQVELMITSYANTFDFVVLYQMLICWQHFQLICAVNFWIWFEFEFIMQHFKWNLYVRNYSQNGMWKCENSKKQGKLLMRSSHQY